MITHCENFVENPRALLVFAHGAGGDKDHPFLEKFTSLLNAQDINVVRFNFPYMDKRANDGKRYPPDRMPKLVACLAEIVSNLETSLPIFVGGKSMGGRVAATWVAQEKPIMRGVVCLGYPFHPQNKPETLRLVPLQQTTVPVLILQGSRDALGNETEIQNYQLSSQCQVEFFNDGDHDLKPRIKSGFTHHQHLQAATVTIARFIDEKR